jgi:hypothetical protein
MAKDEFIILNWRYNSVDVQSTARQTIQNCQISPGDFEPYLLHRKAQNGLGMFDS